MTLPVNSSNTPFSSNKVSSRDRILINGDISVNVTFTLEQKQKNKGTQKYPNEFELTTLKFSTKFML
ncbi:unnamed protein product [Schistosoma rodhaini]|uniref:Uncharacterized protein n=1 Tax=Schistosoma rodhaini TaxID=6188 RepID=A0AA85EQN3_9TREM|nr:unnamed protein product [Schistosoma rodhaini]